MSTDLNHAAQPPADRLTIADDYHSHIIGLEHVLRALALEDRLPVDARDTLLHHVLAVLPSPQRRPLVARLITLGCEWNRRWDDGGDRHTVADDLAAVCGQTAGLVADTAAASVAAYRDVFGDGVS